MKRRSVGAKASLTLSCPVWSPGCCPCCSRTACDWASSRWLSSGAVRLWLCGAPVQLMTATPIRPRKMTACSVWRVCPPCSDGMPGSTRQLWESQSLSLSRAQSPRTRGRTTPIRPPTSPPRHHLIHPRPPHPPPPLPQAPSFSHHQPCLSSSLAPLYWPHWRVSVPAKEKLPGRNPPDGPAISAAAVKRFAWMESRFLVKRITCWRSSLFSGPTFTLWRSHCWAPR